MSDLELIDCLERNHRAMNRDDSPYLQAKTRIVDLLKELDKAADKIQQQQAEIEGLRAELENHGKPLPAQPVQTKTCPGCGTQFGTRSDAGRCLRCTLTVANDS